MGGRLIALKDHYERCMYIYRDKTVISHSMSKTMSYLSDVSYSYFSGDDSSLYVSDQPTCYYCPVHNPYPPNSGICSICHQSCPLYFQVANPQHHQVSPPNSSSSSLFQVPSRKNQRFSPEQVRILEEHFYKVDKYVSKLTIDDLSMRTQLKPAQIRVWFNNKRTREHR